MDNKITSKIVKRSIALLIAFCLIGGIIALELFKIQILGYDDYQMKVIEQLTVETNVNPDRGIIYDRNGRILATNSTVWILYVCPRKIKDSDFIASNLSELTGIDIEKIKKKTENKAYKYQIIDKSVNKETSDKIREFVNRNNLNEQIQLKASSVREYPFSNLASHALGFVNADGVGIYGLEKIYNNILEGTNGKYVTAQNAQSGEMPFQYEEYIDSENSHNLVTTIDLYIQYELEAQLKAAAIESGAENRATGIVMNPNNGEIYAMAVYPSFNLNEPYTLDYDSQLKLNSVQSGTSEYRNLYLNLLYGMWNNKAVTELYEPGSTFKLVTTSVALQEKTASLKDMFNCTGALKVDGFYRAISCHKKKGHGTLNFAQALQQSCNPSMIRLAFGIGKETFYKYFQSFGYTSKTGIDLPSESSGYYHQYKDFSNVSLAVYSFGQTFKTTAIQQLRAVSCVANGGYLVTPHFLKQIVNKNGDIEYEPSYQNDTKVIDKEISATISKILMDGVNGDGGAKNAYVAGYSVAAKTGTSEKKDKYDENGTTSYRVSSCIAYAPAEKAEVAVIIIVDEPSVGSKYGSVVAAPYVSKLLEAILPYMGIEPEYRENDLQYEKFEVGDYGKMSIEEASGILKKEKINYEIVGNGNMVVSQMPRCGSEIYKANGKIILYTGGELETTAVVPNVIGKTAEEANRLLINSGFNVKIEGATDFKYGMETRVVYQEYQEGVPLKKGTVITIKILYNEHKD